MKKLLSLVLALVLVFSFAAVAFAAEAPASVQNFEKNYTVNGAVTYQNETDLFPGEELEFVVTPETRGDKVITLGTNNKYTVTAQKNNIPINMPTGDDAFDGSDVGTHVYNVTEKKGNTVGVTYSEEEHFKITVYVMWLDGDDHDKGVTTNVQFTKPISGDKVDAFNNTFKVGSLTVKKKVAGDLGVQDVSNKFEITVTLYAYGDVKSPVSDRANDRVLDWIDGTDPVGKDCKVATATFQLAHDGTATIDNIPYGVQYVVAENDKHGVVSGKDQANLPNEGYTVGYENEEGTIQAASVSATVTNTKDTNVNTGVSLDSIPYILLIVVAVIGMTALLLKKRSTREF